MRLDPVTLEEAKAELRKVAAKGGRCPCCNQFVKVYRRKLNSGMAKALIKFYLFECQGERGRWIHWREASGHIEQFCAEYSKLAYWGLLEPMPHIEGEKKSSGMWRVTEAGRDWVNVETRVPSHALIYDGKLIRLEGEGITIITVLSNKFDYFELMADSPDYP